MTTQTKLAPLLFVALCSNCKKATPPTDQTPAAALPRTGSNASGPDKARPAFDIIVSVPPTVKELAGDARYYDFKGPFDKAEKTTKEGDLVIVQLEEGGGTEARREVGGAPITCKHNADHYRPIMDECKAITLNDEQWTVPLNLAPESDSLRLTFSHVNPNEANTEIEVRAFSDNELESVEKYLEFWKGSIVATRPVANGKAVVIKRNTSERQDFVAYRDMILGSKRFICDAEGETLEAATRALQYCAGIK